MTLGSILASSNAVRLSDALRRTSLRRIPFRPTSSSSQRHQSCSLAFLNGAVANLSTSTRRLTTIGEGGGTHGSIQLLSQRHTRRSSPNPFSTTITRRNLSDNDGTTSSPADFFAPTTLYPDFQSIGLRSPVLLERLQTLFPSSSSPRPSAVQSASFQLLSTGTADVTIGAETGSGKTLAYLLPLIDDVLERKRKGVDSGKGVNSQLGYGYARAIILVPNKELANQVLRMATHLCGGPKSLVWGGTGVSGSAYFTDDNTPPPQEPDSDDNPADTVRLGILPGGLKLIQDYRPFRTTNLDPLGNPPLDIVVTTPASLSPLGLNPKNIDLFADVQTLIIDEADMLLDGGYLRPLENVLVGFKRADRLVVTPLGADTENNDEEGFGVKKTQHVLVAATLPDMGLKSVDAYVKKKFPYAESVTMAGMHNARHAGLQRPTVWLEDSAEDVGRTNKRRLDSLLAMLQTPAAEDGLRDEKTMVFLNSVGDVDAAANALRRAGIDALPFHAKIPLEDRTRHLDLFRAHDAGEGEPVVLVCTDLAARGLDLPGVTAVVQLQFAGNVVAHLHRMGRCGRAGNRDGRGVVFYGGHEKELVEVVREAEEQQGAMVLKGNDVEFREDQEEGGAGGKVDAAFSRKRGFTKKRKKLRRRTTDEYED